jgi:hypothetical protein
MFVRVCVERERKRERESYEVSARSHDRKEVEKPPELSLVHRSPEPERASSGGRPRWERRAKGPRDG